MAKDDNSSEFEKLQKQVEDQANTIAKLENEIKKLGDTNATPRIIQKGNQKHPKFVKNKTQVSATILKE